MSAGHLRAWAATLLNFVPLAWLAIFSARGQRRDPAYWWLAATFGLGGLFDLAAAAGLGWDVASHVYPVGQSALIAAVLLDRHTALWILAGLGWTGFLSLMFWPQHPDLPLHTAAWGAVAWIAYRRSSCPLRWSLLAAFGLALPCWYWFAFTRSLGSWLALQGAYAMGLALFCRAASRPGAQLRAV